MLSTQELTLLKRCREHVVQLIEIHDGSGTSRPDLSSDLRQIDALTNRQAATDRSHRAASGETRWVDDVVAAVGAFGGTAHLSTIAKEASRRRKEAGHSLPRNSDAIVRDTLHAHSSDAAKFFYERSNTQDLFKREWKRGPGWWSLRAKRSRD
jgi:hypothetical protein